MDRMGKFMNLQSHPMYGPVLLKLQPGQKDEIVKFIRDHDGDDSGVWSVAVRRRFVDNPDKPSNWTTLYELLQVLA